MSSSSGSSSSTAPASAGTLPQSRLARSWNKGETPDKGHSREIDDECNE
jgi:hypothetical protein